MQCTSICEDVHVQWRLTCRTLLQWWVDSNWTIKKHCAARCQLSAVGSKVSRNLIPPRPIELVQPFAVGAKGAFFENSSNIQHFWSVLGNQLELNFSKQLTSLPKSNLVISYQEGLQNSSKKIHPRHQESFLLRYARESIWHAQLFYNCFESQKTNKCNAQCRERRQDKI